MTDPNDASLLSRQGMGGIHGGKGFRAQDAYLCIKVPYWLVDPELTHVLNEGTGDIDVRYERNGQTERRSLQVKDHVVDRGEFREVIDQFWTKHQADPSIRRFVLVSGGLHPDVKALERALARVRGAAIMHADTPTEEATLDDLRTLLTDLKVPISAEWALEYLELEDSEHIRTWPNSAASLLNDFVGQTLTLEEFEHALRPALVRAHESLQAYVANTFGTTISREDVLQVIRRAVGEFGRKTETEGLGVFLDVWGDPNAEARLAHDAIVDWREHFDRETRRIPDAQTWTEVLLPELADVQRRFRSMGTNRQVTIRGNAPLSVGVAVGAAFSSVKGYRLTIEQRGEPWSSATPASGIRMVAPAGIEHLHQDGQGLYVELNGIRAVRRKVEEYIQATGTRFAARLTLEKASELETWTAADAMGVANSVRRYLMDAHDKHGFDRIHLFFALPLGAAILLGHQLNSVGLVQTYEEQLTGGYTPSGLLDLS